MSWTHYCNSNCVDLWIHNFDDLDKCCRAHHQCNQIWSMLSPPLSVIVNFWQKCYRNASLPAALQDLHAGRWGVLASYKSITVPDRKGGCCPLAFAIFQNSHRSTPFTLSDSPHEQLVAMSQGLKGVGTTSIEHVHAEWQGLFGF